MSGDDTYKYYLRDLVFLIRERGSEAKRSAQSCARPSDFDAGRALAYIEVLSLMQHQADAFQLPRDEILLGGFNPETDELAPPGA